MYVILPFTTVLLNNFEITHKAFPFYNILQKFCDIFMLLSFLKLSTMLGDPSTFVTPAGVLNLTTLCQSSPSAVLGTWCANPNHIKFAFPYSLSNLNCIIILCLDPVPHPSTHLCEVFTFSIFLHVFQHSCCFLALELLIPTACHCHWQHLDCSVGLSRHRFSA